MTTPLPNPKLKHMTQLPPSHYHLNAGLYIPHPSFRVSMRTTQCHLSFCPHNGEFCLCHSEVNHSHCRSVGEVKPEGQLNHAPISSITHRPGSRTLCASSTTKPNAVICSSADELASACWASLLGWRCDPSLFLIWHRIGNWERGQCV